MSLRLLGKIPLVREELITLVNTGTVTSLQFFASVVGKGSSLHDFDVEDWTSFLTNSSVTGVNSAKR